MAAPQRWDVKDIRRFIIIFGLISSVFDLLTFGVLLYIFHAGEALFQTSGFRAALLLRGLLGRTRGLRATRLWAGH